MEALNIRSGTAHTPYLLLIKLMADKNKDKDNDPSTLIRTGVSR